MMNWNDGYGYGFGGAGMFLMVLWWALVIVGLVWLVRGLGSRDQATGPSARGLLDERFADGQITAEEYRERRDVLDGS